MNLPNKLTLLRILLVPVFIILMLADNLPYNLVWALIVFAVAAFTDFLDGNLARKYNLVTNFGKCMDPIADKLLVTSAMVLFVEKTWAPGWVVILILAREFLVSSMRLVAAGDGKSIDVNIWGKAKTMVQMIWVTYTIAIMAAESALVLAPQVQMIFALIFTLLLVAVVVLTLYSGLLYLKNNLHIFSDYK